MKPFLKYIGGKSRLASTLAGFSPREFNAYFEPFVGGGALFFELVPKVAYLSDVNDELINAYLAVTFNIESVIDNLKSLPADQKTFEWLKNQDLSEFYRKMYTDSWRAARLIYLNHTSFNGMIRINRKGHFNVGYGGYVNPKILDESRIRACSDALFQHAVLVDCCDFERTLSNVQKGDFVYLDPPYIPLTETASWTSYYHKPFLSAEQNRLKAVVDDLTKAGVHVMETNSSAAATYELYKGYNIQELRVNRAVNCKGDKRGPVKELVITNY